VSERYLTGENQWVKHLTISQVQKKVLSRSGLRLVSIAFKGERGFHQLPRAVQTPGRVRRLRRRTPTQRIRIGKRKRQKRTLPSSRVRRQPGQQRSIAIIMGRCATVIQLANMQRSPIFSLTFTETGQESPIIDAGDELALQRKCSRRKRFVYKCIKREGYARNYIDGFRLTAVNRDVTMYT